MRPIPDVPPAITRYRAIGGVLNFALFEGSDGSDDDLFAAIRAAIPAEFALDRAVLQSFGSRQLPLAEFLGDWCDAVTGHLIRRGKWYAQDGREFDNPELVSLEGVVGDGGVCFPPDAGSGGQFAYAFLCPPRGDLAASPVEIQALFNELRAAIFPVGAELDIRDWSRPELGEASEYFACGFDEWGIFLFTTHQPATGRLAAIAAAAAF